jgi:hypothetical protein
MIGIRPQTTAKDFVSQRAFKKAMYSAHEAVGIRWHQKMLPQHFMPDAAQKYGHKKRTPPYLKRKRRMYEKRIKTREGKYVVGSGNTDNVFTGRMREMLLRKSSIRPYPGRVTVSMTGPRYVTMKTFTGNRALAAAQGWKYGKNKRFSATAGQQPDKYKEVTATTREERDELAAVADKVLEQKAAGW